MKQIPHHWNYMATEDGQVYSLLTNRIMKPSKSANGYHRLMVRVNGDSVSRLSHRLVASAFLGESDLEVNHKDGVKTNNRPENLEYVTNGENQLHCSRVLRKKIKPAQLERGGVGYWWPSQYECSADTGLNQRSVSALHTGTRKTAKGWNTTHFEELDQ